MNKNVEALYSGSDTESLEVTFDWKNPLPDVINRLQVAFTQYNFDFVVPKNVDL